MTIEFAAGSQAFSSTTDLIVAILKPLEAEIPGLKVRSLLEPDLTTPYILTRQTSGAWASDSFAKGAGDRRFLQRQVVDIQSFTQGVDGDTAGDALLELCYQTMNTARVKGTVVPGVGSISYVRSSTPARRVSDWATSTGVQQYANLAKGYTRYQATYGIVHRPDFQNPITPAELVALASL